MTPERILLTGATGYVGGRLLGELLDAGHRVRCFARDPSRLRSRVAPDVDVVQGDVEDPASVASGLEDIDVAYYLVHAMGGRADFEERDRRAATTFAREAKRAGVRRIIYLGGLGTADERLSAHLRSRQEVGRILAAHHPDVVELRASIVIGSGSLSFELVRALVERLPIMLTPRWVSVEAQPIAIADVLRYLVASIERPAAGGVIEIGGADRCSYADLMREYARLRGLRRLMVRVPLLTPRLSSLWLGLVTPIYARVGRKLIGSIRHPTVVESDRASREFPEIVPVGMAEAMRGSLAREDARTASTHWLDAVSSAAEEPSYGGVRFGSRLVDRRTRFVPVAPARAFEPIAAIGGDTGWYYANGLWRIRGLIDGWVGGVGMRRGRRHPTRLRVGDTVDFWRVQIMEPEKRLRLRAEMKLPGRAWLEFLVHPEGEGARIEQLALFDPRGLWGRLYWFGIFPLHELVFRNMLRGIAKAAVAPTASVASADLSGAPPA